MFYSIKFVLGFLVTLFGVYFVADNPLAGCSALFVGGVLILSGVNRLYDTER